MAYFGTATKKIEKIDAPLLVVGIGGTGADGLLRVKSEFSERLIPDMLGERELDHPPRTAYLEIDTDSTVLQKRYHGVKIDMDSEWFDMSGNMEYALAEGGKNLSNDVKEWLDAKFYNDPHMRAAAVQGAGTFRQLSRLMFFQKAQILKQKLITTLQNLAQVPQGAPVGASTINVVVITGLSGGTGSGAFLDFAYLLRNIAAQMGQKLVIELYAVAPDVTISKQAAGDENKTLIYQTNSFAALKELDYWMNYSHRTIAHMPQEDVRVKYTASIVVPWNHEPYDDVTFLCSSYIQSDQQQVSLQNSYNICLNAVAQVLLFRMAGEVQKTSSDVLKWAVDKSSTNDSYSWQSAASNNHAYIRAIKHVYPQLYKYTAIGAYSNIGEQQNKVSLEADLVLTDVLHYCELPDNLPAMNSRAPEAFYKPFGEKIGLLWDSFVMAYTYDPKLVSGTDEYNQNAVKNCDNNSAPHGIITKDWIKGLNGIRAEKVADYTSQLLQKFAEMAQDYIVNNGPMALKKMLEDPDTGFIAMLRAKMESYGEQESQYETKYNAAYVEAQNYFNQLHDLPFLQLYKANGLFTNYRTFLQTALDSKMSEVFVGIMKDVLKKVITEINTQILEGGLKYSIQAFRSIQEEMAREAQNISDDTGIPGRMQQIRDQIKAQYAAEGIKKHMQEITLRAIADAAIRFTDNVSNNDAMADFLIERINTLIERIYSEVNTMSLQTELATLDNQGDEAIISYAKNTIAPKLERGAGVLFAFSPAYQLSTETAVRSCYISIPTNATQVRKGITDYIANRPDYSGAVIKNSMVDDQIFWMNVATGLPLCAYQYLSLYEEAYERGKNRPGTHLLTSNDEILAKKKLEKTVENDWQLLPSPNPMKLMHSEPYNDAMMRRWKTLEEVLTVAEKMDVLYLDNKTDPAEPIGGIRLFIEGNHLLTEDELTHKIEQCVTSNVDPKEKLAKLEELLSDRMNYQVICHDADEDQCGVTLQADKFASKLDLHTTEGLFQAFRELVYYRMSQRPGLLLELAHQCELVEKVKKQADLIRIGMKASSKLQEATKEIARILVFERLDILVTNVRYLNDLDQFETAGEKNVFFDRRDYQFDKEMWAAFLPLEVRMIEWYAEQNHEDEPFCSINRKVEKLYANLEELADELRPDDDEGKVSLHKLADKASKIAKNFEIKQVELKKHQKEMPRDQYEKAMSIIDMMIREQKTIDGYFRV